MEAVTISADVTMGGAAATLLAGRYRVVRQLGQGGMGSVWLAEDTKLDGFKVAIKMLPSVLVNNRRAYQQVKAEALVSLKLSHPNIATVRAFEEESGSPFLVMDYIDGQTLDDYLAEKGKLTEMETVKLLKPVAAALDYAHSQGVVHRDVKPGNVMIRKDGVPFVLDFGIAREIQETMTRVTGKLSSGTLSYMSPEQLHGASPDRAQDVYSFAAVAYECLCGHAPFYRGQIEYQIDHDSPSPLAIRGKLAVLVRSGLVKQPERRPESCLAVLGVSRRSYGGGWNRAKPQTMESGGPRFRWRAFGWYAVVVILMASVGVASVCFFRAEAARKRQIEEERIRRQEELQRQRELERMRQREMQAAASEALLLRQRIEMGRTPLDEAANQGPFAREIESFECALREADDAKMKDDVVLETNSLFRAENLLAVTTNLIKRNSSAQTLRDGARQALAAAERAGAKVEFAKRHGQLELLMAEGDAFVRERAFERASDLFGKVRSEAETLCNETRDLMAKVKSERESVGLDRKKAETARSWADAVSAKACFEQRYGSAEQELAKADAAVENRKFDVARMGYARAERLFSELRKAVVGNCLDDARSNFSAERWEDCLAAVGQVLTWDPANQEASELKGKAQTALDKEREKKEAMRLKRQKEKDEENRRKAEDQNLRNKLIGKWKGLQYYISESNTDEMMKETKKYFSEMTVSTDGTFSNGNGVVGRWSVVNGILRTVLRGEVSEQIVAWKSPDSFTLKPADVAKATARERVRYGGNDGLHSMGGEVTSEFKTWVDQDGTVHRRSLVRNVSTDVFGLIKKDFYSNFKITSPVYTRIK